MMSWLAVLLILRFVVVWAACPTCDTSNCVVFCMNPVPDPCGCCPFLCGNKEDESCSANEPCSRDLVCTNTTAGEKCLCRIDKRMVCGSNNVTYNSLCHMNNDETQKVIFKHWGPCQFGPLIQSGPMETKSQLGMPVTLDCEAKGSPVPSITWTFKGKDGVTKILPGDDQQVAIQVRGGPELLMVTSWVQIVEALPSNEGVYTCEATSPRGSVKAEATLLVRPLA
ncbi:unnamed protein product [Nezara viridula]|uniref:Uncharacterized protein n=1 Tax=Nezara viridula TaxID=85310 RepID=A0A9P0HA82_NEZVI|nr:unnamed protein product [Nezara viridula]